jgi:regulator of sirC expression with transglutaminase-like and TPR domain
VEVVLLLLVVLVVLREGTVEHLRVIMVETHQIARLDPQEVLVAHKVVEEVQEQVLERLRLLDQHCKAALVDKVLVRSQTGLAAVAAVEDTMEAAAVAAVMILDLEPVPLLVVEEDLDI